MKTTNSLGLVLHDSEAEDLALPFVEWRKEINGSGDSAFVKIDRALSEDTAAPITKSLSGELIDIDDSAIRVPISLKSAIMPVQSGSGDPSPDNVRPISGWDTVSVQRTGKNLVDIPDIENTAGNIIRVQAQAAFDAVPYKANTQYTISADIEMTDTDALFGIEVKYSDGTSKYYWLCSKGTQTSKSVTIGTEGTIETVKFSYDKSRTTTVRNVQLEEGAVATQFEPYQGVTLSADLPESVYGGSLDWTTGVLTVTHVGKAVRAADISYKYGSSMSGWQTSTFVTKADASLAAGRLTSLCSHFKNTMDTAYTAGSARHGIFSDHPTMTTKYFAWGESDATVAEFQNWLEEQYAAGTPVTLYTLLKEPYTVQLDPQTLEMLKGDNTVWSDTGSTAINYVVDTQMYIDERGAGVAIDQTLTHEGKAADAKTVGDRLNELSEEIGAVEDAVFTMEIVPVDYTVAERRYIKSDGTLYGEAGYDMLIVPIAAGKSYTIMFSDIDQYTSIALTNSKDITLNRELEYSETITETTYTYTADGTYAYMFIDRASPTSPTRTVEIGNRTKTDKISLLKQEMEKVSEGNVLYGKKWAPFGDSFTAYTNKTTSDGRYATYPHLIGDRNNMMILSNFFASGRTLAYPANPGNFINSITCPTATWYYQNVPEDVDYITIYLGINDGHHASGNSGTDGEDVTGVIPLGTISDNDTSTYYGAWNVVLSWLIENRPFAHIGIIVSNGCDRIEYRTAQLEIAKKYGIPYIDMNGDERTPVMIRSLNPDIASTVKNKVNKKQAVDYDGTTTGSVNLHPNDEAHEYESYFIENFLRSI